MGWLMPSMPSAALGYGLYNGFGMPVPVMERIEERSEERSDRIEERIAKKD